MTLLSVVFIQLEVMRVDCILMIDEFGYLIFRDCFGAWVVDLKTGKARRKGRVVLSDDEVIEDDSSKQGGNYLKKRFKKNQNTSNLMNQPRTRSEMWVGLLEKLGWNG
ncbi:hypothetical protein Tco_1123416 [Tanacetum coccineum]|uniref:Uncharacterized protein n=1 Tax=Tanacetum coccineum TaxID=301880 RepID=A0ABQ5J399_9ASTR